MKRLYTLLTVLFLFNMLIAGDPGVPSTFEGYIVTKDEKRLTGYIGNIYYNGLKTEVLFINDFGTPYALQPQLIKGFVFQEDKDYRVYESKMGKKNWLFLQVLCRGEGLSLYQSPETKEEYRMENGQVRPYTVNVSEFWMSLGNNRQVVRINRWSYKKTLTRVLQKRAPELAEKIGNLGYRYKDLVQIAREYNEEYLKTKWML